MTTRRMFIKACSIALAAAIFPIDWLRAESKKIGFALEKVPKLNKVGGWAVLKIKDNDLLFVRDGEKTIQVLDAVCTHKKCTVEYSPEQGRVVCPCHGSQYSLDGKVLSPPAKKPLKRFAAELADGRVVITLEGE